jgi:hypothetical protein
LKTGVGEGAGVWKNIRRHKVSAFFILITAGSIYYDYSATQKYKAKKQQ